MQQEAYQSIIITDETEPSLLKDEVESGIKKSSDGKAPVFDTVSTEEIKAAGDEGTEIFYKICKRVWETEQFPEDWGRAINYANLQKEGQVGLWKLQRHQRAFSCFIFIIFFVFVCFFFCFLLKLFPLYSSLNFRRKYPYF